MGHTVTSVDDEGTELDFRSLTMPAADDPTLSGALHHKELERSRLSLMEEPDFIGSQEIQILRQVRARFLLEQQPRNWAEVLVLAVLAELRKTPAGKRIGGTAVITGVRLAIARAYGVPIPTHEREIALQLQVRYATLIKIRKLATRLIEENQLQLGNVEAIERPLA